MYAFPSEYCRASFFLPHADPSLWHLDYKWPFGLAYVVYLTAFMYFALSVVWRMNGELACDFLRSCDALMGPHRRLLPATRHIR